MFINFYYFFILFETNTRVERVWGKLKMSKVFFSEVLVFCVIQVFKGTEQNNWKSWELTNTGTYPVTQWDLKGTQWDLKGTQTNSNGTQTVLKCIFKGIRRLLKSIQKVLKGNSKGTQRYSKVPKVSQKVEIPYMIIFSGKNKPIFAKISPPHQKFNRKQRHLQKIATKTFTVIQKRTKLVKKFISTRMNNRQNSLHKKPPKTAMIQCIESKNIKKQKIWKNCFVVYFLFQYNLVYFLTSWILYRVSPFSRREYFKFIFYFIQKPHFSEFHNWWFFIENKKKKLRKKLKFKL